MQDNDILVSIAAIGGKKVAVCGANGYVGRNLLTGSEIVRERAGLNTILPETFDVFVHLAARIGEETDFFRYNLSLDARVFSYCRKHNKKIIYASSNNVYPLAEGCGEKETPMHGQGYYSLSKVAGETLLDALGLEYAALRIGDVFGPGQKYGNFFQAIEKAVREKGVLSLYGKGVKIRSYIYISELVRVIKFFLSNPDKISGATYNVCFDTPYSVAQIVEAVSVKADLPIKTVPFEDKSDTRTMKNDFLKSVGYRFELNIDEALGTYLRTIK